MPRVRPLDAGQVDRIGEVAVVGESDRGGADLAMNRLGVLPAIGAGRRIAGVADADVPVEDGQGGLVEDLGNQSHVLEDGDGLAIGGGDPGRLLAAMLEGEKAEVDELGNPLPRCVDAEYAAGFAGPVHIDSIGGTAHLVMVPGRSWSSGQALWVRSPGLGSQEASSGTRLELDRWAARLKPAASRVMTPATTKTLRMPRKAAATPDNPIEATEPWSLRSQGSN